MAKNKAMSLVQDEKSAAQDDAETSRNIDSAKGLWNKVREADRAVKEAEARVESLVEARSNILQRLAEDIGTGPFSLADFGVVTIRGRKNKNDDNKTFFLVKIGERTVTVID